MGQTEAVDNRLIVEMRSVLRVYADDGFRLLHDDNRAFDATRILDTALSPRPYLGLFTCPSVLILPSLLLLLLLHFIPHPLNL